MRAYLAANLATLRQMQRQQKLKLPNPMHKQLHPVGLNLLDWKEL